MESSVAVACTLAGLRRSVPAASNGMPLGGPHLTAERDRRLGRPWGPDPRSAPPGSTWRTLLRWAMQPRAPSRTIVAPGAAC